MVSTSWTVVQDIHVRMDGKKDTGCVLSQSYTLLGPVHYIQVISMHSLFFNHCVLLVIILHVLIQSKGK